MALSSHVTKDHPKLENISKTPSKSKCKICGKSVQNSYFAYHTARHDPNADLSKFEKGECSECGKKLYKSKSLETHNCKTSSFMFEDNDGNFTFTLCLNQSKSIRYVMKHLQENHLQDLVKLMKLKQEIIHVKMLFFKNCLPDFYFHQ